MYSFTAKSSIEHLSNIYEIYQTEIGSLSLACQGFIGRILSGMRLNLRQARRFMVLTYNLLTIASFRIRVPSIFFLYGNVCRLNLGISFHCSRDSTGAYFQG